MSISPTRTELVCNERSKLAVDGEVLGGVFFLRKERDPKTGGDLVDRRVMGVSASTGLDYFFQLRHLCMDVEACLIDTLVDLVTCWLLLLATAAAAMTWYVVRRYVLKSTL